MEFPGREEPYRRGSFLSLYKQEEQVSMAQPPPKGKGGGTTRLKLRAVYSGDGVFLPSAAVFTVTRAINRALFTGCSGLKASCSVNAQPISSNSAPCSANSTEPGNTLVKNDPKPKRRPYAPQRGAPGAAGLPRAEASVYRQASAPMHRTSDETPCPVHSERSNAVPLRLTASLVPSTRAAPKAPGFQRGSRPASSGGVCLISFLLD